VANVSFPDQRLETADGFREFADLLLEGGKRVVDAVRPVLFGPDAAVDLLKRVDAGGGVPVKLHMFSGGLRLLQGLS